MSITDPVVVVCEPGHDLPYYLIRGRETFYVTCDDDKDPFHWKVSCWSCDHLDEHIRFLTWEEAVEWSEENLGVSPLDNLPEKAKQRGQELLEQNRQRRLL